MEAEIQGIITERREQNTKYFHASTILIGGKLIGQLKLNRRLAIGQGGREDIDNEFRAYFKDLMGTRGSWDLSGMMLLFNH